MKRRINFMCIILTVITILETVALSATVFYGILTKEVIEDLKNSADVRGAAVFRKVRNIVAVHDDFAMQI